MIPQGDQPRREMGMDRGAENRSSSDGDRPWDRQQPGGNERSSLERARGDGQGAERMARGTTLPDRSSHHEGGPKPGMEQKPAGGPGPSGLPAARDQLEVGEAAMKDAKRRGDAVEAERKQQEQRLRGRRVN